MVRRTSNAQQNFIDTESASDFREGDDPRHDPATLSMSWLEADHKAKDNIPPLIQVPEVTAQLAKARKSDANETVLLPSGEFLLVLLDSATQYSRICQPI